MDKPDFISYMMSFIKDHDYPLVHSMNPEELAEVFHISNRCFLVTWALTLLDEDCYGKILKGREQDILLLADMVYCHGFCMDNEKMGFLNGELSLEEQVQILYRMFNFIGRKKKAEKLHNAGTVTLEELHLLKNKELNLFPAFGEIKTLSSNEREYKLEEVQKKIEKIKSARENIKEQKASPKVQDIKKEHIKNIIEYINENLSQFDRVVKVIGREMSAKEEPNYKVDPTLAELLEKCNEYLQVIVQYIEDIRTINEFTIEDIQIPVNNISPLIATLSEELNSIIY